MSAMSEATDRGERRAVVLPAAVGDLPSSVPPLAAVHRLAPADLDALADRWVAVLGKRAHAGAEQRRLLERLGPAACRLRRLRLAERRAHTCPACGFDRLPRPPYLAFEGLPDDPGELAARRPPYAIHFGDPSRERCPCCGYGFGIDDDPADGSEPVSFEAWSRRWTARGRPLHDGSRRSAGRGAGDRIAARSPAPQPGPVPPR
jgi:hypothetical protein